MAFAAEIVTERLVLRRWQPADQVPFAAMNADPQVMEFFPALMTPEESAVMITRIEAHFDQRGFGLWAVEVPGVAAFIGCVGLLMPRFEAHFMPCVEIGWRIAAEHWNRGYATEAARAVLRYGFEVVRLHEIVSFTTRTNTRSRHIMEKLGMQTTADDDFEHPNLPEGHPLRPHVLYRLKNPVE